MDGADKQKLQDNAAGFSGLVGALDEFKDTKKALRGTGWNEFRKVLCSFQKPLSNMQLYSTELEENVQSCMNEINRELDGYTGGISIPYPINFGTVFEDISTKRTACNHNIATLQESLYVKVPIKKGGKEKMVTIVDKNVQKQIEEEEKKLEDLRKYESLCNNLYRIRGKYVPVFNELKTNILTVNKRFKE